MGGEEWQPGVRLGIPLQRAPCPLRADHVPLAGHKYHAGPMQRASEAFLPRQARCPIEVLASLRYAPELLAELPVPTCPQNRSTVFSCSRAITIPRLNLAGIDPGEDVQATADAEGLRTLALRHSVHHARRDVLFRAGPGCTRHLSQPEKRIMNMKLIASLFALAILPACALAQGRPDTVHDRNDCRRAAQIVETGNPAPHSDWAYERIARCGSEGGSAIANALRRSRQSTEVSALDEISKSARTIRDGEVFAASLEVAADPAASAAARVFALRTVVSTLSPGRVLSYEQMTRPDAERACAGLLPSSHETLSEGRPLPVHPESLARDVALRVTRDRSSPAQVVHAARCVLRYARP